MLKLVIFDMDGVIIDSEPIHFAVEKNLFDDLGLTISQQEHQSFIGTTGEAMWSHIKSKYRLEHSVAELVNLSGKRYLDYISSYKKNILLPGVIDLLEDLYRNKVQLILASSSSKEHIEFILQRFKLKRYFKTVVSGDAVNRSKPAPDIFLYAADQLKVMPEECIVIEDSKNGVSAAKSAGMRCIGFKNPNSGNQDLTEADIMIDSFLSINHQNLIFRM